MATARKPMPRMVDRKCEACGKPFQARASDVARGWGRFHSKACAKATPPVSTTTERTT